MKNTAVAALVLALAAGVARADNPVVLISTSLGDIKVELDADKAPVTVKNFLNYVDAKFYDDTVFHRVISNFMIQGGGFSKGMDKVKTLDGFQQLEKRTNAPIKNESANGLLNVRGTIAMARTSDPDSATSQFFINVKDNEALDKAHSRDGVGYCVFGKVIDGANVLDSIRKVKTHAIQFQIRDVPNEDVVIKSITRVGAK